MPAILTCKQASCPDFEVLLPYPDMKISVAQIFQNGVQIAEFTCIDVKHRKQMTSELQETVYCQGRWGDQTVDDQMILSESLISSELRLFRTGLEGAETTLRLPCD